MIFLTVGTTKFPFERLLKAVDKALMRMDLTEKLIVQSGTTYYQLKYPKTKVFKEITFDKTLIFLKKARVVITHGGPATIFLVLKHGQNKPLVVPRSRQFREHINNHQIIFTKDLSSLNLIKVLLPEENLVEKIINYLRIPERIEKRKDLKSLNKLVNKLIGYTKHFK